jgi:hypothetical protein
MRCESRVLVISVPRLPSTGVFYGKTEAQYRRRKQCHAGMPQLWEKGDEIEFKCCTLDDSKGSEIERIGTIRWVKNNMIGCEFTDRREFDSDLGFYFMS